MTRVTPTRTLPMRFLPFPCSQLALPVALLLTFAGCKETGSSEAGSAPSGVADKAGGPNPCKTLGEKLCGELGRETPTCEASKLTVDLLADSACRANLADFEATRTKIASQSKKCDELARELCGRLGAESASCTMVKEKSRELPPAQCAAMLAQVDDVEKELKQQERANQPLDAATQAKIATSEAPSFGPADARITLVEFSDFECPYCSRAATVAGQIKEKYGTRVRLVFRQFPLSFHKNAMGAAEASLAAHAQGKFWEYHDKVFANQRALDRESLVGYAKEIGLDVAKFQAAFEARTFQSRVEADLELGNQAIVQGTPTLFLNGKRINNPTDFDEIAKAIESALGGAT